MLTHARFWKMAIGLNGVVAVIMGAIGAHRLHDPQAIAWVDKASLYQLIHVVALAALMTVNRRMIGFAKIAFLIGCILFCGSLYLKAFWGEEIGTIGRLAPWGGTLLIIGWFLIALDGFVDKDA